MKKIIATLMLIISALQVNGQVNADSIFNSAILNAQEGKYDKALDDATLVLDLFPERYDVIVFCANVNAWKGDYAAALVDIDKAYLLNKNNNALYDSWLNILLWSKDYQNLLKTTKIAVQNNYLNTYNIVLKEAIAYKSLTQYTEGIATIEDNKAYLDSANIEALYDEMQMMNRNRALSFYYSVDL
jgi:tetratricopeptide (TPR) repeat protein